MIFSNSVFEKNKYSIEIDLLRDLQNISKQRLCDMGFEVADKTEEDWIRLFFNAQKRLISNTPRKILKSKEFVCPPQYREALKEIEGKIIYGQSLSMYMSKTILDLKYKDLLLFDWNIHHLHLSKRKGCDGFVKRSDFELFVFFTKDTAYLIQIYPHSKSNLYSTQEMVKILHNNWPDLIATNKIQGVLSKKITDADYGSLRKAGVNTFVEVGDETIYGVIGGGYATDKSSVDVTRNSDYWKQLMSDYQKLIVSETNNIIDGISRLLDKTANRCLDIRLIYLNDDELTFYEKSNDVCLQLYREESYYRLCSPRDLFFNADYYNPRGMHLANKIHIS